MKTFIPPPKYWIWKSLFSCSFGEKVLKYFFWQNWWLLKTPEFEKANYAHFFICRFDEKLLKTSSDNSWKLHCMKILKIQKWYHNCVLWTNIADGIFWGIWTSCRLVSICGKRIKSSCYRMCYFKVVIPSTSYGKKMFFSTRHDEVSISGHDIWGKGLEIDTHKHPKCIWLYLTHAVNTRLPLWFRRPKFTF